MRNLVAFLHISLDGFAAGPKGEMNWIKINEEIFSYIGTRLGRIDTALYGRRTFEMMEGYWPAAAKQPGASTHDIEHAKWYEKAKKLVLSRTMPASTRPDLRVIRETGREISELKRQPGSDIYIFGSPSTVRSLRAAHLIDEYWLFVSPVLLGKGVRSSKKSRNSRRSLSSKTKSYPKACSTCTTG